MSEERMWIAGEWCAASTGETSDVINPATGEIMATVPRASMEDLERSVASSRPPLNIKIGKPWTPLNAAAF
jgi:acyl-CoA reductase-like NAD-dependent aldehyde dehydrogenase